MKISACLMCYNEEDKIDAALNSLTWADEIIVADSFSTDKTPEICRKHTDKFFQQKWPGFAKQREFLLSKTENDWVFFLDSDEQCTPELISKLEEFKNSDSPKHTLYKIHRKEHIYGFCYRYGCGNPSYQDRLFNKSGVKFVGNVHEYPVCEGEPGWVHEYINHHGIESFEQMFDKINTYTTLDAKAMYDKGVRHTWPYMFFSGLAMFLKGYFRKKGFLDGKFGLILAFSDGLTFFLRQAKLWALWNSSKIK